MAQDMEQLYRRHYQTVYRYALRLTGSEHAAEELAAETFYRAMVALPDFRGECAASTWLCQIARNTWTSLRRKEGRCQPLDDTAALPDSRDFAAAFEDKDLALRIHRLLPRLLFQALPRWIGSRTGRYFCCGCWGSCPSATSAVCLKRVKIGPASPITGPGRKSWSKWRERHEKH